MHPKLKDYPFLVNNRHYIILAGFAIGILFTLGFLPSIVSWNIPLKAKFNYVWAGLIGLAGILYYLLYVSEPVKQTYRRPPIHPPVQPPIQTPMKTPIKPPEKDIMEQVGEIINQK